MHHFVHSASALEIDLEQRAIGYMLSVVDLSASANGHVVKVVLIFEILVELRTPQGYPLSDFS